jgi:TPR repeat protein
MGIDVAKDNAEAERLWRLAASQGHAGAQYSLGRKFDRGLGVAKERVEALRFYRLAAAQGHSTATACLKEPSDRKP